MEDTILKIYTKDLITLCHILDEYKTFNKNLIEAVSKINIIDLYYGLGQMTEGHLFFSLNMLQIIRFYRKNKKVIDTINTYSSITQFINLNYERHGKPYGYQHNLDFFYQYMIDNKQKLNQILLLLEKIQDLGIQEIIFNPSLDFTDTEYNLFTDFNHNFSITYVDNIELIPTYRREMIRYRTLHSDYELCVQTTYNEISEYRRKIVVNNLLFDAKRLPNSITKTFIFDRLMELKNIKDANTLIQDLVDLNSSTLCPSLCVMD